MRSHVLISMFGMIISKSVQKDVEVFDTRCIAAYCVLGIPSVGRPRRGPCQSSLAPPFLSSGTCYPCFWNWFGHFFCNVSRHSWRIDVVSSHFSRLYHSCHHYDGCTVGVIHRFIRKRTAIQLVRCWLGNSLACRQRRHIGHLFSHLYSPTLLFYWLVTTADILFLEST